MLHNLVKNGGRQMTQRRRLLLEGTPNCNGHSSIKYLNSDFSSNSNAIDPNSIWKSWFQSLEYQPLWSPSPHSTSFNKEQVQPWSHKELDRTSKYLLSRLDEIAYNVDLSMDIPTTQQCNTMIKNLADLSKGKHDLEARSHRSYLIWRKMEYCMDVRQDLQTVQNRSRFHYMPPRPNRDTYRTVLLLHAKDQETQHAVKTGRAPERALEIVLKMEQRYNEGNLDAEPSVMMWNQVLASWAVSNDPRKSYEAAEILQSYILDKADASSYGFVFRACATTNGSKKGTELAGKVALKMWQTLKNSRFISQKGNGEIGKTMDRASPMIAFAMKAVLLVNDDRLRNNALDEQFKLACHLGIVNTHILQIFQTKASSECILNSLGKYKRKKATGTFQNIPKKWKRNSNTMPSGW